MMTTPASTHANSPQQAAAAAAAAAAMAAFGIDLRAAYSGIFNGAQQQHHLQQLAVKARGEVVRDFRVEEHEDIHSKGL